MQLLAASSGRDLMAGHGLREKHRRLEVDGNHLIECRFGHLPDRLLDLRADAVDEDVDPPVAPDNGVDGALQRGHIGRVQRKAARLVAGSTNIAGERLGLALAAAREYNGGASLRQSPGDGLADAAVPPGEQRDLAGEIEQ